MERTNVRKIFIQRDYSHGTGVRFSTDFPRELTGKVSTSIYCTYTYSLPLLNVGVPRSRLSHEYHVTVLWLDIGMVDIHAHLVIHNLSNYVM